MRFCQSCGMPLTERLRVGEHSSGIDVLGTNADGSKNERLRVGERSSGMDYCMYCYRDGKFLQDCTMEVLTDAKSKEMIWREGDEQYYPRGVTDSNYCVLKFTASDGRFYSDFYPRSFIL